MSAKIETQGQLQGKRIEANCKTIWGSHKDFDFDMETDDWEHYCCVVKEDRGLSFGPPLTMTSLCHGSERAWNELDRMLCLWAKQVESGKPMTKEKSLEIFSGPRGEHRRILEQFLDIKAMRDAAAVPEKA